MKFLKTPRSFILFSMALWITAHVLYALNSLFILSNFLFYFSPFILGIGIVSWVILYRLKKGIFPNPIKSYYDKKYKIKGPMATSQVIYYYFFEFITGWTVLWMILTLSVNYSTRQSVSFKKVKQILEDEPYIKIYGRVSDYGFYIGVDAPPDTKPNTYLYSFKVNTEKGCYDLKALLRRNDKEDLDVDTIQTVKIF